MANNIIVQNLFDEVDHLTRQILDMQRNLDVDKEQMQKDYKSKLKEEQGSILASLIVQHIQ